MLSVPNDAARCGRHAEQYKSLAIPCYTHRLGRVSLRHRFAGLIISTWDEAEIEAVERIAELSAVEHDSRPALDDMGALELGQAARRLAEDRSKSVG